MIDDQVTKDAQTTPMTPLDQGVDVLQRSVGRVNVSNGLMSSESFFSMKLLLPW